MREIENSINEIKDAIEEVRAYLERNHHPHTCIEITEERVVIKEITYHEPLN